MTDYTDLPQVNLLHQNREQVTSAINIMNSGGTMSQMTITPLSVIGTVVSYTPIQIVCPDPTPELLTAVTNWLVQRQATIDAQLAALGVENTPPQNPATPVGSRG